MSMTKKDYEGVAKTIQATRRYTPKGSEGDVVLEILTRRLAARFGYENQRFDRDRFLEAAGVEK